MLETLAKGFRAARQRLTGVAELNDEIIDEALRDVRLSLLEGDVEFGVVKRFIDDFVVELGDAGQALPGRTESLGEGL